MIGLFFNFKYNGAKILGQSFILGNDYKQ